MTLTATEAALAGLLHDIGKLVQRAHTGEAALPEAVRTRESVLLPQWNGRYTHRHALWSDVFFEWADTERLPWPAGIDRDRIRDAAVFHHSPATAAHWLIVEADRMAAGLDRKERDAAEDAQPTGPRNVRRVSLLSTMAQVDIGRGEPPHRARVVRALPLSAMALMPNDAEPDEQPARYAALWQAFQAGWRQIVAVPQLDAARLEQALLGLSAHLLWAVPSSTQDQPDISLHDHARTVAAIAACLALHHTAAGDAADERTIRDRKRLKFRFIELDLSGIQRTLLRLRSEQARGTARILRARSFLIGAILEGAVLRLREALGLPASCVLLAAGGRARLLAPDLPDIETRTAEFAADLDLWMVDRWQGDLALPIGLGPAFAGEDFADSQLWRVEAEAAAALEAAKQRPLHGFGTGVLLAASFQLHGQCQTCGARPAEIEDRIESGLFRCRACDEAHQLGRTLPKRPQGIAILPARDVLRADATLPGDLALTTHLPEQAARALAERSFFEATEVDFARAAVPLPRAHVPLIDDPDDPRYGGLDENELGDLKTFGHIAADALEKVPGRGLAGRRLLAILKADVDRLGIVFGNGLVAAGRTPARVAQLSRLMDGFFGLCLPDLLRERFANTYTVYAGGDDLLLVCPWRDGAPLALALRQTFGRFSAGNPNLTLSAGLAFVAAEQPLNRAVEEADEMLDHAKHAGRDRAGLLGRALTWDRLGGTLDLSEKLLNLLRAGHLPRGVLHTALGFARDRAAAEGDPPSLAHANWWPRWRYHRVRFDERVKDEAARAALRPVLEALLPPPGLTITADAELAASFALWRDR